MGSENKQHMVIPIARTGVNEWGAKGLIAACDKAILADANLVRKRAPQEPGAQVETPAPSG